MEHDVAQEFQPFELSPLCLRLLIRLHRLDVAAQTRQMRGKVMTAEPQAQYEALCTAGLVQRSFETIPAGVAVCVYTLTPSGAYYARCYLQERSTRV